MKVKHFANQECRLRDRIAGAMDESQFCLDESARPIADEIEQGHQLARANLGKRICRAAAFRRRSRAPGHQDLVQRAAAASSWSRVSIQLAPSAPSTRFQNGALAFR